MYDMKKTENGWELWSQLGNPTEHLVATVEKEPVASPLCQDTCSPSRMGLQ